MTFVLALIGAVLGALAMIGHVIAPRTKSTLDDRIVARIDEAVAKLKTVAADVAKQDPAPSVVVVNQTKESP